MICDCVTDGGRSDFINAPLSCVATLPFGDNEELRSLRLLEKQKWRDQLQWLKWENMPSSADFKEHKELPRELQFMDDKYSSFVGFKYEGLWNILLNKFVEVFDDVDSFHGFRDFFRYGVGR